MSRKVEIIPCLCGRKPKLSDEWWGANFWECCHGDSILIGVISGPNNDPDARGWNRMMRRFIKAAKRREA